MPDFKSNENYKKWLAYGHATKVFEKTPGNQPVKIRGKKKKVKHNNSAVKSMVNAYKTRQGK